MKNSRINRKTRAPPTTQICLFTWSIRPCDSSSRTATTEFLAHTCDAFSMPDTSKPNTISVCHQLSKSLWGHQIRPSIFKLCFKFPWIFCHFSSDDIFETKYNFPGPVCIRTRMLLQTFIFSHLNPFYWITLALILQPFQSYLLLSGENCIPFLHWTPYSSLYSLDMLNNLYSFIIPSFRLSHAIGELPKQSHTLQGASPKKVSVLCVEQDIISLTIKVPPLVSAPVVLLVNSLLSALFLTVLGSNVLPNKKYYMPTLGKTFKISDPGRTEVHSRNRVKG